MKEVWMNYVYFWISASLIKHISKFNLKKGNKKIKGLCMLKKDKKEGMSMLKSWEFVERICPWSQKSLALAYNTQPLWSFTWKSLTIGLRVSEKKEMKFWEKKEDQSWFLEIWRNNWICRQKESLKNSKEIIYTHTHVRTQTCLGRWILKRLLVQQGGI